MPTSPMATPTPVVRKPMPICPFGSTIDAQYKELYDFDQAGRLGGDVWIDGFVPSNFFPIADSYYAITTLIHETGHALGLSHPGDYNALGPDGEVLTVTYENQAEYAQDSLQYSIMSYFDGYETGAQFVDFNLLNFAYPSTPQIHDIATIQAIYGADYTTRADDTVYGFHSTEAGTTYDFTQNSRPVLSIWDGGGNDTLNLSGFSTDSTINLNAGTFSSAGGADHFASLDEVNANRAALGFAPRTQATYDYYQDLIDRLGVKNPEFKDNISIAYGVTIENATGGAGNDKIIANEVAQRDQRPRRRRYGQLRNRGNGCFDRAPQQCGRRPRQRQCAEWCGGRRVDLDRRCDRIEV